VQTAVKDTLPTARIASHINHEGHIWKKIRSAASEKRSNKIKKNVTYISMDNSPDSAIQDFRTGTAQPITTENMEKASYKDLVVLMTEIRKLNEIINIEKLTEIVKELTVRLKNCSDPFAQIQIIMEVSNKMST
jgi:hypothetical protein